MRLELENFSKIKYADIDFEGITVIAGDNNTGKSTVGKVLFALFHGMCNIADKAQDERPRETIQKVAERIYANQDGARRRSYISLRNTIRYFEQAIGRDDLFDIECWKVPIMEYFERIPSNQQKISMELLNDIQSILEDMKKISDKQIEQELLDTVFSEVFSQQMNSLLENDENANVTLTLKGTKSLLSFKGNKCAIYQRDINILNDAIYIDNPFIVDDLHSGVLASAYPSRNLLRAMLTNEKSERIISTIMAQEKLGNIYKILQRVVSGEIVRTSMEHYLRHPQFREDVKLINLSAGLKTFVIIKMLLENAVLREGDVLVLDEPEIHLHPEWQMIYAELIVLLQKEFHLTVLLTTHSPFFLDAIEVYSFHYEIGDRVKYYLSSMEQDGAVFSDVTHHIDRVYADLGRPMNRLEEMRLDLRMDV